jgi:hypothetical protein
VQAVVEYCREHPGSACGAAACLAAVAAGYTLLAGNGLSNWGRANNDWD